MVVKSLFNGTKQISDDDLNFFIEKWKKVIGFDYTIEGQPGFQPNKQDNAKVESGGIQAPRVITCPNDGAEVELTFCNGICKTRENCPAHG